jgi:hypothetical protein
VDVEVVAADAVDALRVERWVVDEQCALRAVALSNGERVRGVSGFRWSHDDTNEPFAPCAPEAVVSWGALSARN